MTSAAQQQWAEIAAAIRAHVAQRAALMPAMTPDEMKTFVDTANAALWNEVAAASYDEAIEERQATLARAAQYGG